MLLDLVLFFKLNCCESLYITTWEFLPLVSNKFAPLLYRKLFVLTHIYNSNVALHTHTKYIYNECEGRSFVLSVECDWRSSADVICWRISVQSHVLKDKVTKKKIRLNCSGSKSTKFAEFDFTIFDLKKTWVNESFSGFNNERKKS